MPENIDNLLKQAQVLENEQNYENLASVYRDIAKYYHKKKDRVRNEEFLAKSKEARNAIIKRNQTKEEELETSIALIMKEENGIAKFEKM